MRYCALFCSGRPSKDKNNPDYVPSVFAWRPQSSESGGEQKMSRYERLAKRQRLAVDEGSDHETDWECVQ